MSPLVSICVPVYNGEKYLKECLDSIQSQTFSDFEVVVVDDGSSDSSLDIVRRFADSDKRFRIHRNTENLGLVGNWNRCIELAHGEWIKFLFQDDFLDQHYLEKLLSAADEKHSLVFCRRKVIFSDNSDDIMDFYIKNLDTKIFEKIFKKSGYITAEEVCRGLPESFPRNVFGEPTSFLIKKEVFERYGNFDEKLMQLCDYEFWIRVAFNEGVYYLPEDLAFFRVHRNSTSSKNRKTTKTIFDRIIILNYAMFSKNYRNFRIFNGLNVFSKFFRDQIFKRIAAFYDYFPEERFQYKKIISDPRLDGYWKIKVFIILDTYLKRYRYYSNAFMKRSFGRN